jgi:hypothetical protein
MPEMRILRAVGEGMREIQLPKGKIALVDDEDFERLNKLNWNPILCTNTYYAMRNDNGRFSSMHREIMGNPKGLEVDHIDGNGLNNQKSNLRSVTHKVNGQNKHRPSISHDPRIPRERIIAKDITPHTWKASPEDVEVLKALRKGRVERNESQRVRAGLRALAREKGVVVDE